MYVKQIYSEGNTMFVFNIVFVNSLECVHRQILHPRSYWHVVKLALDANIEHGYIAYKNIRLTLDWFFSVHIRLLADKQSHARENQIPKMNPNN